MLPPLDDADRRRLLRLSAFLCALALLLAPLAGKSSLEVASEQAKIVLRLSRVDTSDVWRREPIDVARDPFIAEATPQPAQTPMSAGPLGSPVVRAVVTGASRRALVEQGGRVEIVGVGDVLAGSRVIGIDSHGVDLQNGTRIGMAEGTP